MDDHADGLEQAVASAQAYLQSVATRPVWPRATYEQMVDGLRTPLQVEPLPADKVVAELAEWAEPGLTATGSGRFYGFVVGGAQPAALAADWLTSTWDQNAGLLSLAPAAAAAETVAAEWLLELLDLPRASSVGFVTGATTANLTCLAAARHAVLDRAGYDVERLGLVGCPPVRVLVGADRHDSVDLAVRYLGLGSDAVQEVASDGRGRIDLDDLDAQLRHGSGPTIVCLQAGEVHTGAFDAFGPAVRLAHEAGAWVHVDGAFGLWARAGESTRWLTADIDLADSWCTDCHKTLNVPYDSGLAVVRDPAAHHAAFSVRADYLVTGATVEPVDTVPEMSRRARGFAVWAALRANGSRGVSDLVDRLHTRALQMADGLAQVKGVEVIGDVEFTQLMVSFGDPDRTVEVGRRLLADGTAAVTPAIWRGSPVQRVSISNWSTSEDDVRRTVAAFEDVVTAIRG